MPATEPDRRPPVEPPHPAPDRPPDPSRVALIRRPYVAEVLAALDEHPRSLIGLRRTTGVPYRLLLPAVRALAAHQAITRIAAAGGRGAGSWDLTGDRHLRYHLTQAGRDLIDNLFHLDVWHDVYDPESPQ